MTDMRELLATAWFHGHCRSRGFLPTEIDVPGCKGSFLWGQAMMDAVAITPEQFPLSDAMRRLIIAARVVAFSDQGPGAMKELDEASEAFADQVPWDDEPEAPAPIPQQQNTTQEKT